MFAMNPIPLTLNNFRHGFTKSNHCAQNERTKLYGFATANNIAPPAAKITHLFFNNKYFLQRIGFFNFRVGLVVNLTHADMVFRLLVSCWMYSAVSEFLQHFHISCCRCAGKYFWTGLVSVQNPIKDQMPRTMSNFYYSHYPSGSRGYSKMWIRNDQYDTMELQINLTRQKFQLFKLWSYWFRVIDCNPSVNSRGKVIFFSHTKEKSLHNKKIFF